QYGSPDDRKHQRDEHVVDDARGEQIRRDKTAGAVERGLAERKQTRIAEQQVETQAEQAPDEHPAEQVGTRADNRRDVGRHDEDERSNEQHPVALAQCTALGLGHHPHRHLRALNDGFVGLAHALPSTPIRPCGRKIRISAMAANSMTSEYTGLNNDVRLRIWPAISPPRIAPGKEPTPPSTTTTNDWTSTRKPMSGTIDTMGP